MRTYLSGGGVRRPAVAVHSELAALKIDLEVKAATWRDAKGGSDRREAVDAPVPHGDVWPEVVGVLKDTTDQIGQWRG